MSFLKKLSLFCLCAILHLGAPGLSFAALPLSLASISGATQVKANNEKTNNADKKETGEPVIEKKTVKGGKSQFVALILCLTLGIFGAHLIYLGWSDLLLLYLPSVGGLGVWWLVSLVQIISGRLKPRDGYYKNSFQRRRH